MAKKPDFALVVGAPKEESEESTSEESGTPSGISAAMEEFLAAVKAEDVEGMASAFHAAFLASEKEPHSEAGESEE